MTERVSEVAMASGKVMDPDNLNENVKKTVYAVRGELYLRASELQKEGKKVRCFEPTFLFIDLFYFIYENPNVHS